MFSPPSSDERARLRSEHAHRFPEVATLRLIGDGGAPVSLPIVLGNPSGACDLPPGEKPSPAWSQLLRASLNLAAESPNLAGMLASDCVLWPDAATWGRHVARWPGLPVSVAGELRRKVGLRGDALSDSWAGDDAPAPLAAAIAADPRVAWYVVRPRDGVRYAVALRPPEASVWRLASKQISEPDGDPWRQVRGLASRCAVAAAKADGDEWAACDLAELVDRFPAIAVLLLGRIGALVGSGAEAELSEL